MKIYLSASQQDKNIYADKVFTEQEVMNMLINLAKPLLEQQGHIVKTSTFGKTLTDNINEGNKWGADIYISFHTNASSNGKADGALGLYYPTSKKGKLLCECIYNEVKNILPDIDDGIKNRKDLAELYRTSMPACLIEFYYHDNIKNMKDGILNLQRYAEAVVKGIEKYSRL